MLKRNASFENAFIIFLNVKSFIDIKAIENEHII